LTNPTVAIGVFEALLSNVERMAKSNKWKCALNSTSILARSNPETTAHSLQSYIQKRALLETITEVF
jgi:hypothetical protein